MPLEYDAIAALTDALAETMSTVVSDRGTVDGTGYATLPDVFGLFAAYGGMYVSSDDGTPPTALLGAAAPVVITDWEASMAANKDVTVDPVTGKITIVTPGLYAVLGGFSIEHNITTRMAIDFKLNGVVTAANANLGFRNNSADVQACPLFGLVALVATDFLEVQWESVVGGNATVESAQFMVVRII